MKLLANARSWIGRLALFCDSGHGLRTRLADGSRILVRPLRPDDRERLRQGIAALSFHTRYLRFHGAGPRPTERELDLLLQLDGRDRAAWGAVDPVSGCGLGVARYARLSGQPSMAELALTVVDRWQRRGLARVLLDRLARSAQAAGIERFRAIVLAENRPVLDWVRSLGANERPLSAGQLEITLPVVACRSGRPTERSARRPA